MATKTQSGMLVNADGSVQQWTAGGGSVHWQLVDESIADTDNGATNVAGIVATNDERFQLAASNSDAVEITSLTIQIRAQGIGSASLSIDFLPSGASALGAKTDTTWSGAWETKSYTWSNISLSKAQFDGGEIQFVFNSGTLVGVSSIEANISYADATQVSLIYTMQDDIDQDSRVTADETHFLYIDDHQTDPQFPTGGGRVYGSDPTKSNFCRRISKQSDPEANILAYGDDCYVYGGRVFIPDHIHTVGAFIAAGKLYISSASTAELLHTLISPNPGTNYQFGGSLAADTNWIVVAEDGAAVSLGSGKAYLFPNDNSTTVPTFTTECDNADHRMGTKVAIGGGFFFVNQIRQSGTTPSRVRVFNDTTPFAEQTFLTDSDANSGFGTDMDVSKDGLLIAIGASNSTAGLGKGAVFIYALNNLSAPKFTITAPDANSLGFGSSVAWLGNDRLAIGDPNATVGGVSAGRVHIYHVASGFVSLIQTIDSPTLVASNGFGFTYGLAGTLSGVLYVADTKTGGPGHGTGRVRVYTDPATHGVVTISPSAAGHHRWWWYGKQLVKR